MSIRTGLFVTASIAAALVATASPASAATVAFTPTYTLGGGNLGCVGTVEAHVDPATSPKGNPWVWARAEFTFIPAISSAYCGVDATMHWRNLDTGATGSTNAVPLGDNTPFSPTDAMWVPFELHSGSGRVEVTITTNFPNIAPRTVFDVP